MANSLANIRDKILARGLMTLRELAVMPRLVNGSYSRDAAKFGSTIDVPLPTATTTAAVTAAATPPTYTDVTPGMVQIPLTNWRKSAPFGLTDQDMQDVDKNKHFFPMQADEAVKALANYVNEQIHTQYTGIYGYTGTAATTPFGSDVTDATNARKVLQQQVAPRSDRRGVLDFDAEANALALAPFSDAEKVGSAEVKLNGEIGRKFGIDWVADNAVTSHTNGGGAGWLVNDASTSVGDTTITIDTGSGDPAAGDIFTIAGDSQTYVVESYASNVITQQPALKVAVADNAALTFKATHVVNLAFHRDAFAFANRPILVSAADRGARNFRSLTDPVTGITLRLEIIPEYKQTVWEFDILFGVKLVRPELAVRIAG